MQNENVLKSRSTHKREISFLNVLFCMMVVFIHITSMPITELLPDTIAVKILFSLQRISGVAVHGFVFLSGMKLFLKDTEKLKYTLYIRSKFIKIYIPYIVASLLYYAVEMYRGNYIFGWHQFFEFVILGKGEVHLYFVFVIMQFYLLLPLWRWIVCSNCKELLLCIAAVINILSYAYLPQILNIFGITDSFNYTQGVFTSYLFLWVLGCVCGKSYEKFKDCLRHKALLLGLCAAVLATIDILQSFRMNYFYGQFYATAKWIRLIYLTVMMLFLYSISLRCSEHFTNSRIFNCINNITFEIYLFHILVIYVTDAALKFTEFGQLEKYAIRLVLVYSISIAGCILYKYGMIKTALKINRKKGEVKKIGT